MQRKTQVARTEPRCDPYRIKSDEIPTQEAIAAGVIACPELIQEIFRRLAWVDPAQLEELRDQINATLRRRDSILKACKEGTFGRDFVAVEAQPFKGKPL